MSDPRGVTRRRALGLLAGATASTALAACHSSSTPSTGSSTHPASPSGSPPRSRTATSASPADWHALRRSMSGWLRRRGSTGYNEARILFDRRFDGVMPEAVARVGSESDIAKCIAFAQRFSLPLRVRSGGHSYIGASIGPGLVID